MFARPQSEKARDPLLVESARVARGLLESAVAAWMADARIEDCNGPARVAGLWALAHGFVMLSIDGHLAGDVRLLCVRGLERCLSCAA